MASEATYDVFLSHATHDKPQVEELARRLMAEGLKPFLDKWHLIPGEPWQEALEEALDRSRTFSVFLGPDGVGPWQNEEMRDALDIRARDKSRRVIPVLLPGASMPDKKALPRFLRHLTWVDFSSGLHDDAVFHLLVCGIKGIRPEGGDAQLRVPRVSNASETKKSGFSKDLGNKIVIALLSMLLGALLSSLGTILWGLNKNKNAPEELERKRREIVLEIEKHSDETDSILGQMIETTDLALKSWAQRSGSRCNTPLTETLNELQGEINKRAWEWPTAAVDETLPLLNISEHAQFKSAVLTYKDQISDQLKQVWNLHYLCQKSKIYPTSGVAETQSKLHKAQARERESLAAMRVLLLPDSR
jgi:hypothetical protein